MVSQEFINNVNVGDVIKVRSTLLDDLIIDKSFRQFNDDLSYASSRMPVIEVHDGAPFETDKSKWDMRYLNRQKAELMVNFSNERIEHLKKVITAVMVNSNTKTKTPIQSPDKSAPQSKSRTGRTVVDIKPLGPAKTSSRKHTTHTKASPSAAPGKTGKTFISEKKLSSNDDDDHCSQNPSLSFNYKTALILGGAAATAVGVAVSEPIVIGTGLVVAGVGVALAVADKNK